MNACSLMRLGKLELPCRCCFGLMGVIVEMTLKLYSNCMKPLGLHLGSMRISSCTVKYNMLELQNEHQTLLFICMRSSC